MKHFFWRLGAIAALAGALVLGAACDLEGAHDDLADGGSGDLELGNTEQEVRGGTLVSASQAPLAPYHGAVRIGLGSKTCSGVKIGARRLLTAAHCVYTLEVGNQLLITDGIDGLLTQGHRVTAVHIHPTYTIGRDVQDPFSSTGELWYDLAIVDLEQNIPGVSMELYPNYVYQDYVGILVGYGTDALDASHSGRKQFTSIETISMAEYRALARRTVTADGEHVHNIVSNDSITGRGGDNGDSGGPTFMYDGAAARWKVAGIVSFGRSGEYTASSRVTGAAMWLAQPRSKLPEGNGVGGFLMNRDTAFCIGTAGGSTASGANLNQHFCDGRSLAHDLQYWQLVQVSTGRYRLRNGRTLMCATVTGGATASGTKLVQKACGGSNAAENDSQIWDLVPISEPLTGGAYQLRNVRSGRCAAPVKTDKVDRHVAIYDCSSSVRKQRWVFMP